MNTTPEFPRDVVTVYATLPAQVARLWGLGLNTAQIADCLRCSEEGACRIVVHARRMKREGAAQ